MTITSQRVDVPRDGYGRPLITPVGGGKAIGYTRASTLSDMIEYKGGIAEWQKRHLLRGITLRPDLAALAHGKDVDADKKELNDIAQQAENASGRDAKANLGTAIHSYCEPVDGGGSLDNVPTEYRDLVAAYQQALAEAELEPVAMETFVVQDVIKVAGTFDRLLLHRPSRTIYCGDIKTGTDPARYPLGAAVQIAAYAHSCIYDPATLERFDLPNISHTIGVLIAMPQAGTECTLHALDLEVGWRGARLAADVRDYRSSKTARPWETPTASAN